MVGSCVGESRRYSRSLETSADRRCSAKKQGHFLRNSNYSSPRSHTFHSCYANTCFTTRRSIEKEGGRNESLAIKTVSFDLFLHLLFVISFSIFFFLSLFFFARFFRVPWKTQDARRDEGSSLNVDVTRCFTVDIFLTYKSVSLIGYRFARLSFLLPRNAFGWTMKRSTLENDLLVHLWNIDRWDRWTSQTSRQYRKIPYFY